MAIVKANYVKRGRSEKARAKATIRYMMHRPGREGQKVTRTLFGSDGVMERKQAYRMIDEAKRGTIFFRIVVSPDPAKEDMGKDLDLFTLTNQTMVTLEDRLKRKVHWVAVEHSDHTPHRHVHALVLIQGKLSKADFQALRQAATGAALFQRHERDLARGHRQRQQGGRFAYQRVSSVVHGHRWEPQAKPLVTYKTCSACGELQPVSRRDAKRCSSCGASLTRRQDVAVGYEEAQWG